MLQALNIFCLIKGFSIDVLHIDEQPALETEYEKALWANVLPVLCKRKYMSSISTHLSNFSQEETVEVKEFLNSLFVLRERTLKKLEHNNYYEDGIVYAEPKLIHPLEIKIAESTGLVTAEYIPEDYKG